MYLHKKNSITPHNSEGSPKDIGVCKAYLCLDLLSKLNYYYTHKLYYILTQLSIVSFNLSNLIFELFILSTYRTILSDNCLICLPNRSTVVSCLDTASYK